MLLKTIFSQKKQSSAPPAYCRNPGYFLPRKSATYYYQSHSGRTRYHTGSSYYSGSGWLR